MSETAVGPPRLVLDHELLWRLDAAAEVAEWEKTLRRAGLWTLERVESEQGRQLSDLIQTVEAWQAEERSERGPTGTGIVATVALPLGLTALLALLAAALPGPLNLLAWGGVLAAVVLGAQWFARARPRSERAEQLARRAHRLLRGVLGRTFIEIHGEVLVENVPHRDYLLLRIAEVEAAAAACRTRAEEMARTRDGIRVANARLGRGESDAETERLGEAIAAESAQAERVEAILLDLRARLARLEDELERVRMYAERRALSERASRLTESPSTSVAMKVASEIEVDVAGIEAEVAGVLSGARDQDARLRAVLEVVGAGRR